MPAIKPIYIIYLFKILKVIKWTVIAFFVSSILAVILYKFVPVYYTPLMFIRSMQGAPAMEHHWVPMEEITPNMAKAVMASEDQKFLDHHGFDYDAIQKAMEHNREGGTTHGASTISQQTAKNVFLWPGRSWIRKGLEAYFTVLIEFIWGKDRIMEVYLNSIEMGDGIYGVEAVAQKNFNKTASQLKEKECALIAATLPNPIKFSSKEPNTYMRKRQRWILQQMKTIKYNR